MKRVLGRLIWSQSRDIRVLNYPRAFVYEIYTNQGFLRFCQDKDTNIVTTIDELSWSYIDSETQNSKINKGEEKLIPTLK